MESFLVDSFNPFSTVGDALNHYLDEVAIYLAAIGKADGPKLSQFKKVISAPLKKINNWVNSGFRESFQEGEGVILESLNEIRYQTSKAMRTTRYGKIGILLGGLLALTASVAAIVKLHQHYHVIPKTQDDNKRKKTLK